jgi:Tfp pilus assembly protein PilE
MFESQTNFPVWGDKRKIESETEARAYLAWSDQFQPQFTMLRDALKRPYSRMDGDYANIVTLPFPNFLSIRLLSRVFAQRTHCYLLVHQPDKAVAELASMHDLSHLTDSQPTGKPMTLVGAMINVAVVGLYADVIGESLRTRAWQEPQLVELQRQLADVHTLIPVAEAFQSEPAASARALETIPPSEILKIFQGPGETYERILFTVAPRGWLLQNIANEVPFRYEPGEAIDTEHERVFPGVLKTNEARLEQFVSHRNPFRILTALAVPNFEKAVQVMARNQTAADEALIVCGLERYRIANGSYPDSLEALVPKFLKELPHDIISGEPLKYRHDGGSFVLYSVGWNEKDEGGMSPPTVSTGKPDAREGDWVWQFAPQ